VIVTVADLAYRYPGASVQTLSGLDFEIREGEVFGFLGPNGSGKSTTQKLLTGILHGHTGDIRVFGEPLAGLGADYYNQIGVCFEFPNLYEKLSAEENLEFHRAFFRGASDSARTVLERLDLPVGDRRPVSTYSKGMKMRVVLARSLLNRPRLWFLDEPTTGQDPQHAVEIRKLIRQRADAGTTVFMTTHDMTVADLLCDRIAFLVEGRIAVVDSPRNLKLEHASRLVRVELRDRTTHDFKLEDETEKRAFLDLVDQAEVETIHTQEPTLEKVFLKITGRGLS
jgi:fluoroquinolone transport system ATP-binding protein